MVKKRICLVIPSLQAGGMERVMAEIAFYFCKKNDIETHLVLYGITAEIFYKVPDTLIIHKPPFRFDNKWRFYYTIKTLFFLRREIKRINPGSILSFGEYWNNFLLVSVFGLRYPVFVSDRSQPDKSLGWTQDTLRHFLYPRAKGIILQTEKAKTIFLSKNRHNNIAVIGNPIRSFDDFNLTQKKENWVIMVGRLIWTKNQDKLIEMFAAVSPTDWKLIIVGYDHLRQSNLERLKNLANELRIAERVEFLGKTDNVDELYARSSIFAFTSSSEGFPNVIGEAMAAGLPVIAYDCVAGPSEMIIDGYNGYLIPLFDNKQFEAKLAYLIKEKNIREKFGSNARQSIKKFSIESVCEAFFKFISE
jgi:GalNAc-alpha-(1->4)-GalNAc-alpha-(1->3)-diNAcBac-PP-undecaprenol alpha-1,4-N-acetyl-D-galactosaminyltransferase